MHRLLRLAIRNWSASPGRTFASLLSVALGVGVVVAIASFYETARRAIEHEIVANWFGTAHVTVHPLGAHWGSLDANLAEPIRQLDGIVFAELRLCGEGMEVGIDLVGETGPPEQHAMNRVAAPRVH